MSADQSGRRDAALILAQAVLDAVPVPAVLVDPELTIDVVNGAMQQRAATAGLDAVGRRYEELVTHCWPISARHLLDAVQQALREATPRSTVHVEVHEDGPRLYQLDITRLELPGGPRYVVSHLDASGEHQFREEIERLRLDRERTQRIARMGTWRLDLETGENTWSPEMYVITGQDPRTFAPTEENRRRIDADPESPALGAAREAIAHRHPFRVRHEIVRPGGARRWFENVGEPERDESGQVRAYVGVLRDISDELEYEQAIERDRSRLERAQAISRTGDIEVDLVTHEIRASAEFRRLFDLDEGDALTPEAFQARIHADDRPRLALFWDDPVIAVRAGAINYRILRRDGSIRHVRGRAHIWTNPSNGHDLLSAYAQDVTELVEAHEQVRQSEVRLREAERVAQLGHWEWYVQTGALRWSDEVYRIFGHEAAAFTPTYERFLDQVHAEDRPSVEAAVEQGLNSGTYAVQHRVVRADGVTRVVMERGELTRAADGAPLRMLGIVQDVTASVEAAEQLRDSEARLRLAVDIGQLGHWLWDLRADTLTWSPETYEIHAVDPQTEPPTGSEFAQFIGERDRARVEAAMKLTLQGKRDYDVTHRIVRHDGVVRTVHSLGRVVERVDGKALRIMGTVRDVTEQSEREETLRRLSDRLVEAQEIARIASWEWDLETGEVEWSSEAWRLYGEDPGSGKSPTQVLRERVPHEEQGLLSDALWELVAGSERTSFEHHIIRGDGEQRTVRVRARATDWVDGRVRRVAGATQDVTEEAEREAEMKRATVLLAQANAMALLAPYEWDPAGPLWWSDQWYQVLGYEPEQLPATGDSLRRIIHPDDFAEVTSSFQMAARSRTGWDLQYRMLRSDGEVRIVRDLSEWVETGLAGGGVFRGSVQDITESARLRQQAQEAAAEVISIIDASLLPIIVIDEQGIVQRMNAATERVFDWPSEDLIGRDVSVLASGVTPDQHDQYLAHYVATGEASTPEGLVVGRTREVLARRRDGTVFPAQLTVAEAELGTNRRQFVGIVMDLSEQKATEERLRQMQKLEALGTLVAGVAHDFNNLLTAIRGGVDMAQEFPEEPRWLEIAMQASDRAAEVVRQLLRFSRRDAPRQVAMTPAELVREATLLSRETLDRRIWFTSHSDEDLPTIQGDPGQIQQVLMNLIVNARDAVLARTEQESGRFAPAIQLTSRAQDFEGHSGVVFEVRDNGTGMTDEVRARALDPFFTTKAADRGTGLGLSAVVGIVERHEGELTIKTAPGEGSEISVWLPCRGESLEESSSLDAPRQGAPGIAPEEVQPTVLIVDDEWSLGAIASAYLEAAGYEVIYAPDGNEAIRQAQGQAQTYSLAILDLNMPSPNGWEVMAALHRQDPSLPVVIASGFADADEARRRGRRSCFRSRIPASNS